MHVLQGMEHIRDRVFLRLYVYVCVCDSVCMFFEFAGAFLNVEGCA